MCDNPTPFNQNRLTKATNKYSGFCSLSTLQFIISGRNKRQGTSNGHRADCCSDSRRDRQITTGSQSLTKYTARNGRKGRRQESHVSCWSCQNRCRSTSTLGEVEEEIRKPRHKPGHLFYCCNSICRTLRRRCFSSSSLSIALTKSNSLFGSFSYSACSTNSFHRSCLSPCIGRDCSKNLGKAFYNFCAILGATKIPQICG